LKLKVQELDGVLKDLSAEIERVKDNPHKDNITSVKLLIDNYDHLQVQVEDLTNAKNDTEKKISKLESERKILLSEIQSLKQANTTLSKEITTAKDSYKLQLQTEKEKSLELQLEIDRLSRLLKRDTNHRDTPVDFPTYNEPENMEIVSQNVPKRSSRGADSELHPFTPLQDREDEVPDVQVSKKKSSPKKQPKKKALSSSSSSEDSVFESPKKSYKKKPSKSVSKSTTKITARRSSQSKVKSVSKSTKSQSKQKSKTATKSVPKSKITKPKTTTKKRSRRSYDSDSSSSSSSSYTFKKPAKITKESTSQKKPESDTIRDARIFLKSKILETHEVNNYSLRKRKYRFVDRQTRSPYKISHPVATSELPRGDPLFTTNSKRKRLHF